MPTDAAFDDAAVSARPRSSASDRVLPAGAGLALAVILGSAIWVGLFLAIF